MRSYFKENICFKKYAYIRYKKKNPDTFGTLLSFDVSSVRQGLLEVNNNCFVLKIVKW